MTIILRILSELESVLGDMQATRCNFSRVLARLVIEYVKMAPLQQHQTNQPTTDNS
jgi:hypothetical protein